MIEKIKEEFRKLSNPGHAALMQRYFKTGKGEYGEGDIFLGLRVPEVRKLVKKHKDISIEETSEFLKSKFHEERLFALITLAEIFKKRDENNRVKIYTFYLKNTNYINNWDLVDVSAGCIVGDYLFTLDKKPIYLLASSNNLWERRIAIIATSYFIAQNEFDDTLKIAEILLNDKEVLIHKAVGWMLREVGKKDMELEESFLKKYHNKMPRTMLRYAIEKFPERKRKSYLKGIVKDTKKN